MHLHGMRYLGGCASVGLGDGGTTASGFRDPGVREAPRAGRVAGAPAPPVDRSGRRRRRQPTENPATPARVSATRRVDRRRTGLRPGLRLRRLLRAARRRPASTPATCGTSSATSHDQRPVPADVASAAPRAWRPPPIAHISVRQVVRVAAAATVLATATAARPDRRRPSRSRTRAGGPRACSAAPPGRCCACSASASPTAARPCRPAGR